MKALVKSKAERGLWLEDVAEPAVGINDVLIRVLKTGICGTDLHIYEWDAWAQRDDSGAAGHRARIRGRDCGGGLERDRLSARRQIVSGEGHVVCGRCRNCLAGRRHLCAHTEGVGVNRPGAFAEYIALPMTNIWLHAP